MMSKADARGEAAAATHEASAATSLLLLPVTLDALMLLALISESPDAAAAELDAPFLIAGCAAAAAPEFSLAAAASFAFFCCSQDCSSSSRDIDLFRGCIALLLFFVAGGTRAGRSEIAGVGGGWRQRIKRAGLERMLKREAWL